jgi:hypothetical protein
MQFEYLEISIMKISIRKLLLLAILACCFCTGSAYAYEMSNVFMISFNPEPPFWPGEHVEVSTTIDYLGPTGPIPVEGATVNFETDVSGYFASGLTDKNGLFKAEYIVPNDYFKLLTVDPGHIIFTGFAEKDGKRATAAFEPHCKIIPKPELPEFPTIAIPVVALLGLVLINGRRKD